MEEIEEEILSKLENIETIMLEITSQLKSMEKKLQALLIANEITEESSSDDWWFTHVTWSEQNWQINSSVPMSNKMQFLINISFERPTTFYNACIIKFWIGDLLLKYDPSIIVAVW